MIGVGHTGEVPVIPKWPRAPSAERQVTLVVDDNALLLSSMSHPVYWDLVFEIRSGVQGHS